MRHGYILLIGIASNQDTKVADYVERIGFGATWATFVFSHKPKDQEIGQLSHLLQQLQEIKVPSSGSTGGCGMVRFMIGSLWNHFMPSCQPKLSLQASHCCLSRHLEKSLLLDGSQCKDRILTIDHLCSRQTIVVNGCPLLFSFFFFQWVICFSTAVWLGRFEMRCCPSSGDSWAFQADISSHLGLAIWVSVEARVLSLEILVCSSNLAPEERNRQCFDNKQMGVPKA